MFSSESPFGKTFGASVQDPLASFGWRGLDERPQTGTVADMQFEEDQVPMVLETGTPGHGAGNFMPTSPRMTMAGRRETTSYASGVLTSRGGRRAAVLPADSTWVTVFGVQPHQTALVKAQIEQLASTEIVDVRPGGGNFFHARFPTTSDARSALQLNGHMIDGSLIVGVTPCVLTTLDEEPMPATTSTAASATRRKTLVPSVAINKQPSIFDNLWRLLDAVFQYN